MLPGPLVSRPHAFGATLASFALRFGPPEYFALLLLGLLALAT
jgi:TctA family transporter